MIRFALYFHNHQPVGNFDEVFEYAYNHSYRPLLEALLKHQGLKFGIHNSGPLCDWLEKKHPEYFEMLKEAVRQDRVEILSSAYGEPILSLIPRNDAIDQIRYFNDYLYKKFDYQVKGLWLTERVWEPGLISILLDAGIEYTLLDDTHFRYAGLAENELSAYYITEEEGRILKVFPIAMKLRYLIPFHQVEETIDFLKKEEDTCPCSLKILGDDGEKFGVWPGTYDWVYGHNWLKNFLSRLQEETWIKTVFLKDIIKEPPAGRVYIPTASYEEMGEWALPPEIAGEYEELKKIIDKKYFYLIHGGYFKNFLRKYPAANLLHKRMIFVSKNIADNPAAKLSLWRGQCSCVYWHGIFGGLYLPHLREAVYRNLIEAESFNIKPAFDALDFNADGQKEIIFSTENFFAVLAPESASFIEIDDRKRKTNILNYLPRKKERYHEKLPVIDETEGVKSIHEIFQSKEKNLARFLIYDKYERSFGLDHNLKNMPAQNDFYSQENLGDLIKYQKYEIIDPQRCYVRFTSSVGDGILEKSSQFLEDGRTIEISYQGSLPFLGVEFSLGIFNKNLKINGTHSLYELQTIENLDGFAILAEDLIPIEFKATEKFTLLSYPIETISSSESGLERNFQGFSLLLVFTKSPSIRIKL